MNEKKLDQILNLMVEFAHSRDDILALGLCGSWARGEAKPDSDIDLSIIVKDKLVFKSGEWFDEFPFQEIHDSLKSYQDEEYGVTWSRHVFLDSGMEIEFGFAEQSWANIDQLDEGTRKVVSDGYRILYDPSKILSQLIEIVEAS